MGLICWGFGFNHFIHYPYNLFGIILLSAGIIIAQTSKNLFLKLRTNVNTFDNPDKLVTEGLYKFSRNPMYLGFVIALAGIAVLYQAAISSFLLVALFILITDRWYIKYEENVMMEQFGEQYIQYCEKTRRWI